MLDAVIDVMNQNTSSALTLIRIVIFQQQMLNDFQSSMQEREAQDPKDNVGFLGKTLKKLKCKYRWKKKHFFCFHEHYQS